MTQVIPLKTVFAREYQRTHYKKAVYPLFADMRFENVLTEGSTVQWDYDDDAVADSLTSADEYQLNDKNPQSESLVVDQKPSHGFRIPGTQKIQDHHPTQQKWAKKAMNVIFQKIDGDVLGDLVTAAGSTLDAALVGGNAGDPITTTPSNASNIFAASQRVLTNNNVLYDENKVFANNVQLDGGERMPVAAIPAELKENLLLQVGFKNTDYADKVMKSGFMGPMFGFNTVASTSLPFSFRLTFTATPADGSVLKIGSGSTTIGTGTAVNFTWETGTITDAPGKVKAETSATVSVGNLVAGINAGCYTDVSGDFEAFVRDDLSNAQKRLLDNISAVDNEDGSCVITIKGYGTRTVSQDDANGEIDRKAVHALFGVSRSIGMVMQRNPLLAESAGDLITTGELSGFVGKHFLAWGLYGRKVFHTMQPQVIDVPIAADNFSEPASVVN